MNCKNCNHIVNGNYCAHCGQSTKVDRINLPNFLSQLSESIFQIDRGFFYTLKALFVRPGHSIKEYLQGKRKNHFKPIAYLLTLSTIYFLLSQFVESGTIVNDFVQGFANASLKTEMEARHLAILKWFAKNYAYTTLLLLPVYSLASYLVFAKAKYNYLEHVVLNAYITGQQAVFYSLSVLLIIISNNEDLWVTTALFISIVYTFFVFWQFFSEQGRVAVILRSILTYVLYFLFLMLVIAFIFILGSI